MLTSWRDADTPSHWTLFGLVGGLSREGADTLLEPFLAIKRRLEHEYPALQRPRYGEGGNVLLPAWPMTAEHWLLYSLVAGMSPDQAREARRPFGDLVERVQAGENMTKRRKPAKGGAR